MPYHLPSSFASAASGQVSSRDSLAARGDVRGGTSGDWSRKDGRSINGTLTFRRFSTTPIGHTATPPATNDNAVQPLSVEDMPVAHSIACEAGPSRYSREKLFDIFRSLKGAEDLSRLYMPGWCPKNFTGTLTRSWGKGSDTAVPQEPGACWDQIGHTTPLGLQDMSTDEKEAFSAEINSTLKPPSQNKDGHQSGTNGRKASVSHGSANAFGINIPSSSTRPGTRRRETLESHSTTGALVSPTAPGRFRREESSSWLTRKSSELEECEPDDGDADPSSRDDTGKLPSGSLSRANTCGGSASLSIPWPPLSQTTPSLGTFGHFSMAASVVGDMRVVGSVGTGASRLAHLIPKDSHDCTKSSDVQNSSGQHSWRPRTRTDTDPYGDELSGSTILGDSQDIRGGEHVHGDKIGIFGTPVKRSAGDFGQSGRSMGGQTTSSGRVSPLETNPYRSPRAEHHDHAEGDTNSEERHHAMRNPEQPSNFGSVARGFGANTVEGSDRSQTSSVGARGYPLSGFSGWPTSAAPSSATPDRERPNLGNAFGSSLFSPMGDLPSPGIHNLSNVFGPTGTGSLSSGNIGRISKLGSLFPSVMQAQMPSHEYDHGISDNIADPRLAHPLGVIGRSGIPGPPRDTESPMRSNRGGVFEELFPSTDVTRTTGTFGTTDIIQPTSSAVGSHSFTPVCGGLALGGGSQSGNEPPATQVRQMVMPDRMRWVYLDPQGQVQGPFTGLEMNDWYKANFFTPDLRVKKLEDPEFEPLGQLIRRIGNSREPFLVPQIGIAHGEPPPGGSFTSSNSGGGVVPPLSGVFPSFGRTLTAEEQNNLERRKQEEQYIMAQQREYMLRQQARAKFPMPGGPGLQHHSSIHSLQSQPSYGSIASPIGAPQKMLQQVPQPIGSIPLGPFLDHPSSANQPLMRVGPGNAEPFRADDLANLSPIERQVLVTMQGGSAVSELDLQQQRAIQSEDLDARSDLLEADQLMTDPEGFRERLQKFENLCLQHESEQVTEGQTIAGVATTAPTSHKVSVSSPATTVAQPGKASRTFKKKEDSGLSFAQQVQQTQETVAAVSQPTEHDMPMPFPAPSMTPLPAPTAQRIRSNLPEQYSRSQSGSPEVSQPPLLAPWAKDPGLEGQKGPSLKEIQEAEARKTAKAAEAASSLRKIAMEQESAFLREKKKQASVTIAAGLLPTSTWGHGSPVSTSSPWTKPGPAKGPVSISQSTALPANKKTLTEIQREEELRKQKARDIAIQSGSQLVTSKSYANLASRSNQTSASEVPSSMVEGSGWATVGAGGKVKLSTGLTIQGQPLNTSNVKNSVAVTKPSFKLPSTNPSNDKAETNNIAMEEFSNWTRRELLRGLTNNADVAEFQTDLHALPLDESVIADAIYVCSKTMDARHFAEEYVRRKKLAEKGIIEKQISTDGKKVGLGSSGWSEVAKRNNNTQTKDNDTGTIQNAGFKVVPSRKKGKK